jgi:tetratricopeptide (TPR) repeat protein
MTRLLRVLPTLLLLLLCAAFCVTELAEVDLHWHLLAGRRILDEGRVPRADDLSYVSAGREWIDLHWMFQVLVAGTERLAGWGGLDSLKIALIVAAFTVAYAVARRRGVSGGTASVLLLLAILAAQERFTLRPEAVSFLLLATVLLILGERHRRPGLLWTLPPLFALWANLHALYAAGLAAVALTGLGDLIERARNRFPEGGVSPGRFAGAGVAALLATVATPWGVKGWLLPGRLLLERIGTDNLYGRSIAEFQAPFGGFGTTTAIRVFAGLAILLAVALALEWRRVRAPELLLLAGFFGLALLARRNLPLFSLVALAGGGGWLDGAARQVAGRWSPGGASGPWARRAGGIAGAVVSAAAVLLLVDVASNRFFVRDGTQRYFGRGPTPGFYPEGAATFVLESGLPGEAIHDLSVGGYLAGRWHPRRRIFIDGRLEVHHADLFASYLRLQADPEFFERVARRHDARIVVAAYRPEWAPLLRHLAEGHGWRPVYVDLAAAVFARADPGAPLPAAVDLGSPALGARVLQQVEGEHARSAALDPVPAWIRRLLPRLPAPVAEVNAGLFFGMVGADANAEILFRSAILKDPGNPVLHYDLGLVLAGQGRHAEAGEACRRALELDPDFVPARLARAAYLLRAGDPEGALREWEAAGRRDRFDPGSLRARGALLASRGRLDEAIEDLRAAIRADPRQPAPRADLALLYQRRGLDRQAREELERARSADPRGCVSGAAAGRLSAAAGRIDEAERSFRDLLAGDPRCTEALVALAGLLASAGRSAEAQAVASAAVDAGVDPAALSAEPSLRMLQLPPGRDGGPFDGGRTEP